MKRRLIAVLLAVGLIVSGFSTGAYAAEAQTETAEQVTEAVTEESERVSETTGQDAAAQTEVMSREDFAKAVLSAQLTAISGYTDKELDEMIDGANATSAAIAANWKSVKEELGAFAEVIDAEMNAAGTEIIGHAKYEKIGDNTEVTVTYSVNKETQAATFNWDIAYPMGIQMQRAGMNTVMGLGIVFLTLVFLSWLIGQLHIIPDMIEKRTKKEATEASVPAPANASVPAVQDDLTDDLELVAVITAAIAASEHTSSDNFVVRSIKKANKRNWQRA